MSPTVPWLLLGGKEQVGRICYKPTASKELVLIQGRRKTFSFLSMTPKCLYSSQNIVCKSRLEHSKDTVPFCSQSQMPEDRSNGVDFYPCA